MKVHGLRVEGFKRVEIIDMQPDQTLQIVSGSNAAGKSSLLDSIWVALGGGAAAKGLTRPVKDGHTEATIRLDLGDLIVTRTFDASGTTKLTVTNADGVKQGSPQTVLDRLIGKLGFDPGSFLALSDKEQRAAILRLVELPFDLAELEADRARLFEQRTEIGRGRDRARGAFEAIEPPEPDAPTELVSSAAIGDELAAAHAANAETQRLHAEAESAEARRLSRMSAVAELERQLESARRNAEAAATESEEARKAADAAVLVDTAEIEARLRGVEEHNANVRRVKEWYALREAYDAERQDYDYYTSQLNDIDTRKAEALADAKMPVEGLTIGDEGLLLNEVPFAQASQAERIRVAVGVAVAGDPTIRIVCVRDASLLDDQSMRALLELANEHDFQVFAEVVGDAGDGVTIVDGRIA